MQTRKWLKNLLTVICILFPLAAMLVVLPMVFELPPFIRPDNTGQILFVIPFYLGLVAAPGYIYFILKKPQFLSKPRKIWVGTSLLIAFLASLGGLISILTVINIPFIIGSVIVSLVVMVNFFKQFAKRQKVL